MGDAGPVDDMTHRLLLDVSSLTYRAYFAVRDGMFTADGMAIQAAHGYLDMVARLAARGGPTRSSTCTTTSGARSRGPTSTPGTRRRGPTSPRT